MDLGLEKHTQGIDQNMPLPALCLLTRIVADIVAGIQARYHGRSAQSDLS
jgi:hypothetical protein